MGDYILSGHSAVKRGTAPKISLSLLFRELSCLRHLCRLVPLTSEFGRSSGLQASCDAIERKYHALQKNAMMALTI